jgi:hypothetical protein
VPKSPRLYYVRSPASSVSHLTYSRIEGDTTFCGRRMKPHWYWAIGARYIGKNISLCAHCQGQLQAVDADLAA